MGRQVGGQVGAYGHRPHAWPSAPVRDAEGLVQVQVADVRTEPTRFCQSYQGVEVRAIDVHLPTGVVHQPAELAHALFEDAVGGRVGDHHRGEVGSVLLDLRAQVVHIDVAVVV